MADVPPLHKLALAAPTATVVRLANCNKTRRPLIPMNAHDGWATGYRAVLEDIRRFLRAQTFTGPTGLHIVDGSNLMFVTMGGVEGDRMKETIPTPPDLVAGLPIVVMKRETFDIVTDQRADGSKCFTEKFKSIHKEGTPIVVVVIGIKPGRMPRSTVLDKFKQQSWIDPGDGRNPEALIHDDACALMPKEKADGERHSARNSQMYQHFYCEYDDVLATKLWKDLATTEVPNLERSPAILSQDYTVNKHDPRKPDDSPELKALRTKELLRQLASTESLLNDLGTDLQLELFKIEPEVAKQSANDIMYKSFQTKQKRGRVPSPSPGAGSDGPSWRRT
tara:strand:- start:34 stop:1041 length:1008 start_codon:yes stop_codon:yes gene_type:complete